MFYQSVYLLLSLVMKQAVYGLRVTSGCSEEDGLSSRLLLDERREAFKELWILSLSHGSEDGGRSPTSRVHCSHTEGKDQQNWETFYYDKIISSNY